MKRDIQKGIKPLQLVRYVGEPLGDFSRAPFKSADTFVYLGETEQMPVHGTFIRHSDGKVFVNWHTDAFQRIPDDEA